MWPVSSQARLGIKKPCQRWPARKQTRLGPKEPGPFGEGLKGEGRGWQEVAVAGTPGTSSLPSALTSSLSLPIPLLINMI